MKCRRCGLKTVLSDEDIQKAVDRVRRMKGVRLAEEKVFEERFSKCRGCEKLEYGSTCMLCGCIMQVRARLFEGKCPKNKW
ncbi:MAG: DUF6171 family protein [Clostridiales bacterium]|nr:DUF6171 family protein [Clostridiales bacterium]